MIDRKTIAILGVVLACVVLIGAVIVTNMQSIEELRALITKQVTIPTTGQLIAIGVKVYWDIDLTNECTEIDWGELEPSESKSIDLYIKSISNVPITLSQATDTWNPIEASNYIHLTWNYTGIMLAPNEVICVRETLSVDSNIQNIYAFSFNIIISATN